MKIKNELLIITITTLLSTSGCSTWRKINGTEKGAVGAVGGGLVGNEQDKDHRHR